MSSAEAESIPENFSEGRAIEAPRFSCALGGALGTAVAIYGTVPILHSGAGCGIGQLFGQLYAGGQNAGGPQGGTVRRESYTIDCGETPPFYPFRTSLL